MIRKKREPPKLGPGQCNLCERHKQTKNICIPGSGPTQPEFVVIAESPSSTEDVWCRICQRTKLKTCEVLGHPIGENLVGPAGRLLEKALLEAGFDPATVFKLNAVACSGGTPTMVHAKKCRLYWLDELTRLDLGLCKAIILLGEFALRAVTDHGRAKISEARLRSIKVDSLSFIPSNVLITATYHPSAALPHHDPSRYDEIVSDLLNIGKVRDPIKDVNFISGSSDISLKDPEIVGLDLEWKTDGSIHMAGIASKNEIITTNDVGSVLKWLSKLDG